MHGSSNKLAFPQYHEQPSRRRDSLLPSLWPLLLAERSVLLVCNLVQASQLRLQRNRIGIAGKDC